MYNRFQMEELIEEFISQDVWAVVGFSANSRKFGNIIYRDLSQAGYRVYAVNLRAGQIDGVTAYPHVGALPEKVGVVDLVVPPESGLKVVRQCARAGLTRIWMQPGAESPRLIELCAQLGLKAVYNACAMVEKRRRKQKEAGGRRQEAGREQKGNGEDGPGGV